MKFTTKLPRWLVMGLAYPLLFLNGWLFILTFHYFQAPITIFITATLLAFVLDYPVEFLKRRGMKRNAAILVVFLLAFLVLALLGLILVPIILAQFTELAQRLPSWIDSGNQQLTYLNRWALAQKLPINFSGLADQVTERLSEQLQALSGQILSWVLGTVGSVLNIFLTVVLTFYLVLHGERLWDGIFGWLPFAYATQVREALRQNFHNYFIGQATLAVLMGFSMTVAFLVLQVPFGLLFGLGMGIMALFPFGVGLSIAVVSFLIALQSIWLGLRVLVVATIIDQVIENGIAPRLLGGFTGLNPVWILVSLIMGARIGGLLGLVMAVPLASCIKSLMTTQQIDL
ncbi:MAG TPA: AI-2E family transporter [Cyanobacteria bacterium UBA8803]|nr:AI-2E family transporter [Cyanobacteria bacterium UBA9273]HBL58896.1 AI-2E family transporter [Cyanobacteria bacterium UBA8803]